MFKNIKVLFFLLLFAGIVYHNWFLSRVVTNGDWQFHFAQSIAEWVVLPFVWLSQGAFGGVNVGGLPGWPFYVFHGLAGRVGLDSGIADKYVFFLPSLLFGVIGSYFLVKKVSGSVAGAVIGSLVFMYNTYFLLLAAGGQWTMLAAYSFAPLVLLFYIITLEERKISWAILTGLVGFVVSYYEFRAFYVLAGVMVLYLLFDFLVNKRKFSLVGVMPFAVVGLLNSYWVAGLIQAKTLTNNEIFNRQIFGSGYMNLRQTIALFHPFWSGGRGEAFKVYPVPAQFFLIPLFAFLGFYFSRHNKKIIFWGVLAVIGVFLAKQDSEPFGLVYRWLFNTVPGFKAFRESSKFYFLTSLSYSVLIGMFVAWLITKKTQFKYFIFGLIAIIFIWNTKSVITGEIGGLSLPRKIPADYLLVRDFLQKDSGFSRVLWVPEPSRWSFYTSLHPKVSLVYSDQTIWKGFSKYGEFTNDIPVEKQITYPLKQPIFSKILELSSIKYVMIPLQDTANDDDFYIFFGPRSYYLQSLEKLNYLKKINLGTKDVVVYENLNFRPRIYLTPELESPEKDIPFQTVNFTRISPAEYKIKLPKLFSPVYLNFTEAFHPEWQLKVGSFLLPDKGHIKSILGLNSFLIDPKTIKSNGDTELTLYFRPQTWVNYGLMVSGGVLGIAIFYLIFAYVFSKK